MTNSSPKDSPAPPAPSDSDGAVHDEQEPLKGLPTNVTYSGLIARNKRNSAFLILMMNVLITGFGGAVGIIIVAFSDSSGSSDSQSQGLQVAPLVSGFVVGAIFGIVVAIIATIWSWFGGSAAILRMTGSREIVKSDDPQLFNVVEELSIAAGIPMPRVYLIDDPAMNAFATGRDPKNGVVAITTGLRKSLSRDELAGVIAHEISHIRHYDIRLGMLMATLAGIIIFMSDAGTRVAFYSAMFGGGGRSSRGGSGGGGANPLAIVIVVLAIIFAILAPVCAMVVRFAMSRQREFLADAGAVELTRYPDGLIGALKKLGGHRQPLRHVGQSTAPLFIVNPLKRAVRSGRHDASTVFSTHPPLTERIQRLSALK
jgi:heat shock protein HtpX